MKHLFLTLLVMLMTVATLTAQQIAVVSSSGSTKVFSTLDEAIEGASAGSTIYLPGGGFHVSTKIDKQLTLLGISHKGNSVNADGNTSISGNLDFAPGSDGSAVMGVYLHGDINIGVDGCVSNITVKYCNINSIQVKTEKCPGIYVNQNYLRSRSGFGSSNVVFTNNVSNYIQSINGGTIEYNIICGSYYFAYRDYRSIMAENSNSRYNVLSNGISGTDDIGSITNFDFVNFIDWKGITSQSDCHFKDEYTGDKNAGIYAGGTGFSDGCLPPAPHIVEKAVAEQTDANGKLHISVKVKAN